MRPDSGNGTCKKCFDCLNYLTVNLSVIPTWYISVFQPKMTSKNFVQPELPQKNFAELQLFKVNKKYLTYPNLT